ncbi:MAG: porin family protein [Bacteroidia bacterium]|nr:porin family protein [Bacteroidia bacterium]
MKRFIVLFIAFAALSIQVFSQRQKLQNQPYADQRIFHLGFMLGMHTQDLILTHSGHVSENGEVWFSEIPSYSPGFSVGIIADLYLNKYMNLRAVPTLHLGSKDFIFREQTSGEEFNTTLKNNYMTMPLQLKFTAGRINNYRPYLLAGAYGSVELAPRKNRPLLLKPYDYGIEIGFGCDFYLPYFKLCPELKFCFGLADILEKNRSDLTDMELMKYPLSLSGATQRMIVLSFNFE